MERTKVNLESREYDLDSFVDDIRFQDAKWDFIRVLCINVVQILLGVAVCYGLSPNGKRLFGFPQWYVVASIVYFGVALFCAYFAFYQVKDVPLTARLDKGGK